MEVLNFKIDNLSRKEIFEKIEKFLAGDKFCQIATINPEFILTAQKDEDFKKILNNCDLNVADGIGIRFAFWKLGFQKLKCRMAGADLMDEILKIAESRGSGVFLVANKNGLSTWEETRDAILQKYPNLKIKGVGLGSKCPIGHLEPNDCDIFFCNFGAPYQEKFLNSLRKGNYGKIRLAMGVGGAFDFWAGKLRRAPRWMRKIGLEWLFRLVQQPKRFRRIFRAVIIFPTKVLLNK